MIPETRVVRARYARERGEALGSVVRAADEFDAWLAAHDAQVTQSAADERQERISEGEVKGMGLIPSAD